MKKTIIGVILILLSIAGIVGWEMFGREELMYTDMLVLNQDVEAYQEITKDMLATRKIYNPMEKAYKVADIDSIVGKETTQYIAKGSELFPRYFEEPTLNINPYYDYVFSLDVSNLQAYPRSIKKGDTAYLFRGAERITAVVVISLKDSSGLEVSNTTNKDESTGVISSIEFKVNENDVKSLSQFLLDGERMTLAYN